MLLVLWFIVADYIVSWKGKWINTVCWGLELKNNSSKCDLPPGPSLGHCWAWSTRAVRWFWSRWWLGERALLFWLVHSPSSVAKTLFHPLPSGCHRCEPACTSSGSGVAFCLNHWPGPLGTAVTDTQRQPTGGGVSWSLGQFFAS